jgi:hypothetical protein
MKRETMPMSIEQPQLNDNTRCALQMVHRMLISARSIASSGTNSAKVATILDDAEYLVVLLINGGVPTSFESYLEGLGEGLPEFAGLYSEYRKCIGDQTPQHVE